MGNLGRSVEWSSVNPNNVIEEDGTDEANLKTRAKGEGKEIGVPGRVSRCFWMTTNNSAAFSGQLSSVRLRVVFR
ncbi:hypothetical protein TSUD_71240 [Trifolium subterraneum]|uniref:Uncharacterized protein n=1 Tax=Trifolium subterraneum TaxID=3900 RepID=A0A2Z6MPJ8_TRISU|nr:hypothetical protein TSUD_71240 [Trifolium subterraneum]